MKTQLINRIDIVMKKNNVVIKSIEDGNKINAEKAVKACMKSINEISDILKIFIYNNSNKTGDSFQSFVDILNKK